MPAKKPPTRRLPPNTPSEPVKGLALIIGQCVDLYCRNIHDLTPSQILQAIEWVRYNYTEAIITKGVQGKGPGEFA